MSYVCLYWCRQGHKDDNHTPGLLALPNKGECEADTAFLRRARSFADKNSFTLAMGSCDDRRLLQHAHQGVCERTVLAPDVHVFM